MLYCYILSFVILLAAHVQREPEIKLPTPYGSIKIKEGLYMDKAEVANMHWLAYLQHLRQDSSENAYRKALPDTTVWNEVDKNGYLRRTYLRSYRYYFHPVVGISYEQAEAYNKWRSARDTESYNSRFKNKLKRLGLKGYKVVFKYRLPTISEWEMAAAGGLDPVAYPYGVLEKANKSIIHENTVIYDSLRQARPELVLVLKQHLRRNPVPGFNTIKTFGRGFRYGLYFPNAIPFYYTASQQPVFFIRRNNWGFYDTIGNVAEMVSEKGKAKGGSWMHYIEYSKIRNTQTYNAPAAWLGFRSVCEVSLEPVQEPAL